MSSEIGVYIHVPFCKQACHYCNFHFSTSLKLKEQMLHAMRQEIASRRSEWGGKNIRTIYFGGGTPSVLSGEDIKSFIDLFKYEIKGASSVNGYIECTLEANPDDLSEEKIIAFIEAGINRFSIGVQSFFDEHLDWMNRSHNAQQANEVLAFLGQKNEISVSADLIFALPNLTDVQWQINLEKMLAFDLDHWSCYNLTVEPNTALHHRVQKRLEPDVSDIHSAQQFEYLMDFADANAMDHYEISNYCKPGKHAVHNTSYWQEIPYIGIGPSAHSFDGDRLRSWNIAHNAQYIEKVALEDESYRSSEKRAPATIYNEYVMTSLRTKWGCKMGRRFDETMINYFGQQVKSLIAEGYVTENAGTYYLTRKGKLNADWVASELFWV